MTTQQQDELNEVLSKPIKMNNLPLSKRKFSNDFGRFLKKNYGKTRSRMEQ